ncbi:hypothetical protein CP97_01395 [Aurantiacibacter atlanticus]|uniref:SGNH hydrolase-type esterase domain-containing protein n=1 Tax=Aurantiacibacter atlanticus TaxID=1648404 RepID=A0A0H4VDP6_9SPHN|nr:SGNH/GDSL hydrolase family protein [Aurantiacibacter atlanticus]AKQ40991.1 hypothetical protein CP97_01395 [Aurantiacibacter atlanticus]
MKRIGITLMVIGICVGIAGAVLVRDELPGWTRGGSRMKLAQPLAPVHACPTLPSQPTRVLFLGDSNMSGVRLGSPLEAFPHVFSQNAAIEIIVDNRARGGAPAQDALSQAQQAGDSTVAVLMFGTNDADPRGWLSPKEPRTLDSFKADLEQAIAYLQEKDIEVLLLAALPSGSRAIERRIEPYRNAMRSVALRTGVAFRDPAAAFQPPAEGGAYLQRDALHLNARGQRALAKWLLECFDNSASDMSIDVEQAA